MNAVAQFGNEVFRELSMEEIQEVSGGVKYVCKVSHGPDGTVISCEISGEF